MNETSNSTRVIQALDSILNMSIESMITLNLTIIILLLLLYQILPKTIFKQIQEKLLQRNKYVISRYPSYSL